jgi:hypothetical protein
LDGEVRIGRLPPDLFRGALDGGIAIQIVELILHLEEKGLTGLGLEVSDLYQALISLPGGILIGCKLTRSTEDLRKTQREHGGRR